MSLQWQFRLAPRNYILYIRTPADADEHPLAQLVGGVGEHDGRVQVAALAEHPEEIGGVEIVEGGRDETAPNLEQRGSESIS